MKHGKILGYAPNFEEYLQQIGNLGILSLGVERKNGITLVKGRIPREGVDCLSYRVFLDGKLIGTYTEVTDAESNGRLRRLFYKGCIPGYKFTIAGKEQEDLILDCFATCGRGYTYERIDGHKKISFP